MRRFFMLVFLLAFSSVAWSQTVGPITITTSSASPSPCITLKNNYGSVAIKLLGTWTSTAGLQPTAGVQGQTQDNTTVIQQGQSSPQGTITANGTYKAAVNGNDQFCLTGFTTTGTATLYLTASPDILGPLAQTIMLKQGILTGQNAAFGLTTIYTTTVTGLYRISASVYATANSSTAWAIEADLGFTLLGQASALTTYKYSSCTVGTTGTNPTQSAPNNQIVYIAAGQAIQIEVQTDSGSNTGGTYTLIYSIEQV